MSDTQSQIVFVNRDQELAFLRSLVPPACRASSLVIIKAPSGFGKSTLTDRLIGSLDAVRVNTVIIDPNIRLRSGDARIHDGFFIQRCAEELSARRGGLYYPDLRTFLGNRRWRTVTERKPTDIWRSYPTPTAIYNKVVEYVDRFFAQGDFSVEKLLKSDSRHAVALCVEYIELVFGLKATISVVREAQHIDHESLRFFLRLNKKLSHQHLFIEYTCENWNFDPDHEKLLLREIDGHPNAHILSLAQLDQSHLERLIRSSVSSDFDLTSDYYLKWNGNLRSIVEMRYRVAVTRQIHSSIDIQLSLANPDDQLNEHLNKLGQQEKLLIAIIVSHVEAIGRQTLFSVVSQIDQFSKMETWQTALRELITIHNFVELRHDALRIQNEDIAEAVRGQLGFNGLIALSQKELRNFYLKVINSNDFTVAAMPIAIRQALMLCAKTHDSSSMLNIVSRLSEDIRHANDQSIYVDAVIDTITSNKALFKQERTQLVDWAASLAYDTCDFSRAVQALISLSDPDLYQIAMLACCQQEIGLHQQALSIVRDARRITQDPNALLATALIEFLIIRDLGDIDHASKLLNDIFINGVNQYSPLFGYALRFSESVNEFPLCTEHVLKSVEWFAQFGLVKSQAYSELAAAMHLAREGNVTRALALLQTAKDRLAGEVRDQHIILNNQAAVSMLTIDANLEQCGAWLATALRTSRDDYSDVTILNNLAIVHSQCGRIEEAINCIERILVILRAPLFADRDIFGEFAFTASTIFESVNDQQRADAMRALRPLRPSVYGDYWDYRFGATQGIDPKFQHLLRFDYHPLFISHWLIDREGLALLR